MNRRIVFLVAFLILCCSPGGVCAQLTINPVPFPIPRKPAAIYAVKFLCGLEQPAIPTPPIPFPNEPPVKPGNYATAVNILNFHNTLVKICKKAVVALPEACSETAPNPNRGTECNQFIGIRTDIVLTPDQALEVDCSDIVSLLGGTGVGLPPFIKGFVEIVVPAQDQISLNDPLGVTGVYTAQQCTQTPGFPCDKTLFPGGIEVEPQTSHLTELPQFCGG
ncbi:MAG TPA: hypothetical protein VJN94_10710 [Candidatus Binataceae bacterium]|nr:hypothetical protein [Candidatus Binataceae bacterium]